MPGKPRREILGKESVEVIHCYSRCVQSMHLCGQDALTGEDFEYRKLWVEELFRMVASLFAIDFGFEAVMSNHIHLLLRTRPDVAGRWSDRELVRRWLCITRLRRTGAAEIIQPSERQIDAELKKKGRVRQLRKRMADVSWLMGTVCENISRRCNREAERKGHFWESRYQCRRLLNPAATLLCGFYIDLNFVSAGLARTPEASRYTSFWWRLQAWLGLKGEPTPADVAAARARRAEPWLAELTLQDGPGVWDRLDCPPPTARCSNKGMLEITLDKYLQLLDCVGRQVRAGKKGVIPAELEPILVRLGLCPEFVVEAVGSFDKFGALVGSIADLKVEARAANRKRLAGMSLCAQTFA